MVRGGLLGRVQLRPAGEVKRDFVTPWSPLSPRVSIDPRPGNLTGWFAGHDRNVPREPSRRLRQYAICEECIQATLPGASRPSLARIDSSADRERRRFCSRRPRGHRGQQSRDRATERDALLPVHRLRRADRRARGGRRVLAPGGSRQLVRRRDADRSGAGHGARPLRRCVRHIQHADGALRPGSGDDGRPGARGSRLADVRGRDSWRGVRGFLYTANVVLLWASAPAVSIGGEMSLIVNYIVFGAVAAGIYKFWQHRQA